MTYPQSHTHSPEAQPVAGPPGRDDFEAALLLPWQTVFEDPGAGDWRDHWFLDGLRAEVGNTGEGMVFTAGPEAGDDACHAVLWTRRAFAGDIKVEYDFTRLDAVNRYVNILYLQASGTGEGPYAADIAEWSRLRETPWMRTYYNHMNLLHISYAAFGNRDDAPDDYIRARRYPVPEGGHFARDTQIEPDYRNTGLFETGVTYRVTCIKRGRQLFFEVDRGGDQRLFTFDTSGFPPVEEGRIGLRHMYTRSSRYANFTVSVLPPEPSPDIGSARR